MNIPAEPRFTTDSTGKQPDRGTLGLQVDAIHVYYGGVHALKGITLHAGRLPRYGIDAPRLNRGGNGS